MANFYSDEKLRQEEFHEIIRELFSKDVKVLQLDDKSSNDEILELDFHTYSVLYLLIEIQNEIGTGKCDPTTQAAASYAKFYTQNKYQRMLFMLRNHLEKITFRSKCCRSSAVFPSRSQLQ